jgi:hypothetical protein
LPVADVESVRIELAFEGGQIIAAIVSVETADALERAIAASSQAAFQLDTDDGRISVALPRVVYVKRYARDSKVGFGIEG